jgi:hypothetical protein
VVADNEKSSIRVIWRMLFVTASDFTTYFGVPPSSVPGVTCTTEKWIDGTPTEGALILPSDDFPEKLFHAEVELVTERDITFTNFVHDKKDLHPGHGVAIFNAVQKKHLTKSGVKDTGSLQKTLGWVAIKGLADAVKQDREKKVSSMVESQGSCTRGQECEFHDGSAFWGFGV